MPYNRKTGKKYFCTKEEWPMTNLTGISNWKLTVQRENERIMILRASTCDTSAVLPDELFGLPVTALSDRALSPSAAEING
jgi:hypothetical protein